MATEVKVALWALIALGMIFGPLALLWAEHWWEEWRIRRDMGERDGS